MPPFNNPATGTIPMGDVPEAVMQLDKRVSAIENYLVNQGAPAQPPAGQPATADARLDDMFAVLEKYFGKELAEASAVRLGPQNPGVAVQPGPAVVPPPPAQTMVRPGLTDPSLSPDALPPVSPSQQPGFVPSPQPPVNVMPDNRFTPAG